MSVAFRRESDEEHLEPKFELPVPPGPNLVTPRGLGLIEAKVAQYEAIAAPTDEQKRDMRYWRKRLASAQLAPPPATGQIGFGSRVTFTLNGKPRIVEIVGDDEADPTTPLLALSSPLAQALMGAEAGDVLAFGGKADAIEVASIAAA